MCFDPSKDTERSSIITTQPKVVGKRKHVLVSNELDLEFEQQISVQKLKLPHLHFFQHPMFVKSRSGD